MVNWQNSGQVSQEVSAPERTLRKEEEYNIIYRLNIITIDYF